MTYTQKSAAKLFEKHNRQFRGMYADVNVMGAIAMAESGGEPRVTDNVNTDGSRDRGLWQINSRWHPELWRKYDLYDPELNAEAAGIVWAKQGYDAWSVYKSGRYKEFMPDRGLGAELKKPVEGVAGVTDNIGNSVRASVNAITETVMKVTLSGGAFILALVLIVMGIIILARKPVAKVVGAGNPVGKAARVVKKVA